MSKGFKELKDEQRKLRDSWTSTSAQGAGLRVHRALSWLKAAEECVKMEDGINKNKGIQVSHIDTQFMHLWIAFNALYGQEQTFASPHLSEKESFKGFFEKLLPFDSDNKLQSIAWDNYSQHINTFINNQYVFAPYWEFVKGGITEKEWQTKFKLSKELTTYSFGKRNDIPKFLGLIFERLYVLRNQIMHGGATFNGSVNRSQMKDGTHILAELIPAIIEIVMNNPEENWGIPTYPPIV